MGFAEHLGVAAALSAGILWGFLGFFVRELSDAGFSTLQMTCVRYIIVAVAIGGFIFTRHRRMLEIDRQDLILFAVMGIGGTLLNSVFFMESMTRISLSLATVLQYISPFIVVVISVPLFKEKLTASKVIALVVAFLGCILCTGLISDPGSLDLIGISLAIASGLLYSLYTLGSKVAARKGRHIPTVLLYTAIFCAVTLMPFADLPDVVGTLISSPRDLALMLGLGIGLTLLPFGLYNLGISLMEAGKAAIISFSEPLAATVIGFVLFHESVTPEAVVGMALILISLAMMERHRNTRPEDYGHGSQRRDLIVTPSGPFLSMETGPTGSNMTVSPS